MLTNANTEYHFSSVSENHFSVPQWIIFTLYPAARLAQKNNYMILFWMENEQS